MDDKFGIVQNTQQGNVDELSILADGKEVIAIVPAEDVLLTMTKLPAMHRARLAQALPYALEEQLVGDVDTLHFASGDYLPDGNLPVAIVAKQKIQTWIDQLQSWNLQADVLVPQTLALPVEENTWQVVISDTAIVRIGIYQGFACDSNNLRELIDIALISAHPIPQLIHIHNYTQQKMPTDLGKNNVKEDFYEPAQLHADLAEQVVKFPFINLLQGSYKTKKAKYPHTRKIWNAILYLAIAWVFLLFLYPTVSYFILKQRLNDIDLQIARIYKHNFPQSSSIVAPKLRIEEKLQKLSAHSGENKLLFFLSFLGKAMLETPSIHLNRLDYQNNQLILQLTASSEDFSKFTEFLTRQGLRVNQQNVSLLGATMNATIIVE
jgi:general secretion pathway protein L